MSRALLIAWGTLLVGAMTWALFLPTGGTAFALRDMVVLDHPYLTHSSLGFGDLPGRNVPQDAVLALVGAVVPATWFVRVVMVAAAAAAAFGAARMSRSPWTAAAAMAIAVANPLVIERLLQGQWSLVIAVWLLPLIAWLGQTRRAGLLIVAVWAASLTPTGALAAVLTALFTHRTWRVWVAAVFACAPWVVTGALAPGAGTASAASVHAFAPRAEAHVGTFGTLLGLGGIWNGDAVPASREAGFAAAGIALFVVLLVAARHVPRPLLVLAALGFVIAVASWLAPAAIGWLVTTVPGAGLLRDGQKWLMLAIPAYVTAAGALPRMLAMVALVLSLLQSPDAPRELQVLAPVQVSIPQVDHQGRDVYFIDRPTLLTRADGIPVVDPATKAMNVVESGGLSVDGQVVDQVSPRYRQGLANPPANGIGLIVHPDGTVTDTGAPARPREPVGLGLLAVWAVTPLLGVRRRRGAPAR